MSLNLANRHIEEVLSVLNGIGHPEKIKSLDLSGNELTSLPSVISKFINLNKIDLMRNNFSDIAQVASVLGTLPMLQSLNIDLYSENDVTEVLKFLPNLTTLNGETTGDVYEEESQNEEKKEEIDDEENDEEISLFSERDVFNNIINQIKIMKGVSDGFEERFANVLKEEINKINEKIDLPEYLYKMNIVKSKIEIFSFLSNEIFSIAIKGIDDSTAKNTLMIADKIVKAKISKNEDILYEIISQLHLQQNNHPIDKEIPAEQTKPIVKENNRNSSKKETDIAYNQSNSTSQIISSPSSLLVSKKILLSTIKHIMRYHKEMNKSNLQSRLPEQNLKYSIESYFSKKYGVKSLVENYVNELYSAIEKFSDEESEVKLFEKILSSRIDENSYDTYNELKDIVDNLLKDYIRDNSSFKPKNELDRIFKLKTKSFISYDEWKYILNIIFNNDYNVIHSQIIQFISDKNSTDEDYNDININYFNNSKMTREQKRTTHFKEKYEIKYTDFICLLLDFQIKLRERYLNVISNAFNSYDDDGDGVIEENQFRKMIASFNIEEITEDDVNKLLDVIDPFEYGNVSFNMCVKALSDTMCGNDMSLLDKIITKK